VPAMDYLIADAWTLPPGAEVWFTEKIWRLPGTYLCFTPPDEKIEVSPLPALSHGHVTFGSLNAFPKMTDEVVALWARVLTAVPDSRLLLKARSLNEFRVQQDITKRFAAHGIGNDKLVLVGSVPGRAEHLAIYNRVDIALDPFPYPGVTTSAEALWMGVPVLTLAGDRFLSRQGVGLLMNAGLPEWIASDPDDYVARAVSHAGDLQSLAALRVSLRGRFLASPICDARQFAHNFEQALEEMWRNRVTTWQTSGLAIP
jgi:protein O-GlcNAc transferase